MMGIPVRRGALPAGGRDPARADRRRPVRAGTRLPSINDLVQEFGVAQTTAGKALRLRVEDGLAEISQGMGFYVKENR